MLGSAAWDHLTKTARRYGRDLAGLVQALPQAGTLPRPDEAKKGAVITVEDVEKAPPATILCLFEALREELPAFLRGEEFNSRIRIDVGGVEVLKLKEHVTNRDGETPAVSIAMLVLEAACGSSYIRATS